MSLKNKYLLWFAGIGAYVMLLGGVFYYQLFKWTFDEKLKQDIVGTVGVHAPVLINGLLSSPAAISFGEYDVMTALSKDERIVAVVYVGRNNKIRWHKDARFIDMPFDKYNAQIPFATDALSQAVLTKKFIANQTPGQPFYEIAIPFSLRGDIIGVMNLTVSRARAQVLIGSAMRKYLVGALGVLLLLGLPLFFFFTHYVLAPIEALREKIRYVSMRSPELRFAERRDEIGALAGDIAGMADKMRKELEENSRRAGESREAEELWWRSLLKETVPPGSYALVVNQDNNVLYANFETGLDAAASAVHLLDLLDNNQQDLLRLVAEAFESPGTALESETSFKGRRLSVRVLHTGRTAETSRTLILFSPRPA